MITNPFPDLPPDDYDALLLDIEKRGMVYPVIRDQNGQTIDGHQRERACAALGIAPHYRVVPCANDTEREALAIVLNTHRRHLTPEQRREAILRLAPTGMTQREIGAAVGVSAQAVNKAIQKAEAEGYQLVDTPDSEPDVKEEDGQRYRRTDFGGWVLDEPLLDKQGRPPESRGGRPRADEVASRPVQVGLLTVKVMMTLTRLDTNEQATFTVGAAPEAIPSHLRDAVTGLASRLLGGITPVWAEEPEDDDEYHDEGEELDPELADEA